MFKTGLTLQNQFCNAYQVLCRDVPSPAQVSSRNATPKFNTILIQPNLIQFHIIKAILFLVRVEKSLIHITRNFLHANLVMGWTLCCSSTCDLYPFRNEVLIPGEGGVNA